MPVQAGDDLKATHVLVDLENNQPTLEDVRRLVPEVTHAWLFHSRSQVKRLASFAPLGAEQTPVPISRPGKNALDFHLAFYVGYIASRNPGARIVIVAIDRGYRPMIEHAVSLGFDVTQVPFKPGAATAPKKKAAGRKVAAKKVTAKKAAGKVVSGKAAAAGKTTDQAPAQKAMKKAAKKSAAPKAAAVKPDAGQTSANKAPAGKSAATKTVAPKGPKGPKASKPTKAPKGPKVQAPPPQAPKASGRPETLNAPVAKEPTVKTRAVKTPARQVPKAPAKKLPAAAQPVVRKAASPQPDRPRDPQPERAAERQRERPPKAPARPQAAAKPPAAEKVLANLRTMGEKLPKKLRQLRRYVSSMLGTGEADPAVGRVVEHLVATGFVRVSGEALAYGAAAPGKSG